MALAILVAFLVVTTPTRERVLRGRLPSSPRGRLWGDESRPATRHAAGLALLGSATFGFLALRSSGFGLETGLLPAIAFPALVFFYGALTQELKLAFARSYKAWLVVLAFLFWVVLPAGAGIMGQFEITRPFSWPLLLASPWHVFHLSVTAFDPISGASPSAQEIAQMAGALGIHVLAGFVMTLHVRRLRREIPGEFERLVAKAKAAAAPAPAPGGATA